MATKPLQGFASYVSEVGANAVSCIIVFDAFGRQQPLDVTWIFLLNFAQMAPFMPAKGEHHVPVINSNFSKVVDRLKVG